MYKKFLIHVLLVLGFSACSQRKMIVEEYEVQDTKLITPSRHANYQQDQLSKDTTSLQVSSLETITVDVLEAQLTDVSFPFKPARFVKAQVQGDVFYIEYKTPLRYQQVIRFYQEQMELLGWTELLNVESYEICLVFKKGKRLCVLSVRPTYKKRWYESSEQTIIITVEK